MNTRANPLPRGRATADNATITVTVPPNRVRWLLSQLDADGIPYEFDGATLTTMDAAQPIVDQVLGHQPASHGLSRFDLLSRQRQNRSRFMDSLGFALALLIVGVVIVQSGHITTDPTARAVIVGGGGLAVTLLISEMLLGSDPRRWLFILGMSGLFGTAAFYFAMQAMGVL